MEDKTFTIEVTMKERWIDTFLGMLKRMEYDGSIGHSEFLGFYADGDGDFRPKFNVDYPYNEQNARHCRLKDYSFASSLNFKIYDAG